MPTDELSAQQAALDAEDAAKHLDRIAAIYKELAEKKELIRTLTLELKAAKTRARELGWDLQHRLDQASKRRVAERDEGVRKKLAEGKGNGRAQKG